MGLTLTHLCHNNDLNVVSKSVDVSYNLLQTQQIPIIKYFTLWLTLPPPRDFCITTSLYCAISELAGSTISKYGFSYI